jgi:glycosyltransferase involved in cell wall biosynthesis
LNNCPKISIITPNFNGAKYLEKTILSVINQEYPNLEYIIIDGGSTDGSIDIIEKYENKISFFVSEPDNGIYDAIQKGFDKSTGDIMAWINSDDMYYQNSFSILAEIFSNFKDIKWLMGIPAFYDEFGRTIHVSNFKRWSKFNYYTKDYQWVQQESVFWRRELWEKVERKINTDLKLAGDLDLWLRFFRHDKLYTLNALLSGFRIRSENQLSLDFEKEYKLESEYLINQEIENYLSKKEKYIVRKICYYKRFVTKKNRLFRFYGNYKVKKLIQKYYDYPYSISFNRFEQRFTKQIK